VAGVGRHMVAEIMMSDNNIVRSLSLARPLQ